MPYHNNHLHCRIGSLEISKTALQYVTDLHCRIGSLEITINSSKARCALHCRIGSLEICAPTDCYH